MIDDEMEDKRRMLRMIMIRMRITMMTRRRMKMMIRRRTKMMMIRNRMKMIMMIMVEEMESRKTDLSL